MIPTRVLVFALLIPQILSLWAVFEPSLLWSVLFADAFFLSVAALDAFSVRKPPSLHLDRQFPDIASLERPFWVELTLRNQSRRVVQAQITESWPDSSEVEGLPGKCTIRPGQVSRIRYRVRAIERGPLAVERATVRSPSLGGFWLRQYRVGQPQSVRIYPDVQAIRHWELRARQDKDAFASRLTRLRGGDTEFERLRDYRKDDEVRRIDWKATARRRKLTVRDYQLEQNQTVMVLLDCGRTMLGEWGGISAFDHAVNATLMLSHVAARRGDRVGLVAFGEKVERFIPPAGGRLAPQTLVRNVYDLFPKTVEPDYEAAIKLVKTKVTRRTLVVLITHALDEPTAQRLESLTRDLMPRHLPLLVVLRDADIDRQLFSEATDAASFGAQAAAAEITQWWDGLSLRLRRAGVLVLDSLHKNLTGDLLSRYLEIKAKALL